MDDVLLVPAGIEAYRLYQRAAIYCCPSSYGLPRHDVERIAFYAQGIMTEIPAVLGVVQGVDPLNAAPWHEAFTAAGGEPGRISDALRRWHTTFARARGDVDSAIVWVLSEPQDPRTAHRSTALRLRHGERAFQGRAYFRLDHLLNANTLTELRRLRDTL